MIRSAAALRRRAERCLRFADQLALGADPAVPALRTLAEDYEAAARGFETQAFEAPPPRRTEGPLTLFRREPDRRSSC